VPLWHHAPGPRLAFQTTTARLLVWRDGVPATAEPLLPLGHVGAHAPALATLAADVSHLCGLDPARSLVLVVATGASLLLVGLFALHATWAPPVAAALGALVGLAAAPWPGVLAPWGEGEALLALALALPAAALLAGHASRSSAMAGAMLLAAAALAQPVLAALVGLAAAVAAGRRRGPGRPGLAVGLALALAAPGLWPLARSLSLREAAGTVIATQTGELPAAALGLLFASLAPIALLRLEPRGARARRPIAVAVALVATALLVARVHGWIAAGQMPGATRAALARDRGHRSARCAVRARGRAGLGPCARVARGGGSRPLDPAGLRRGVGKAATPCLRRAARSPALAVTSFDRRRRNHRAPRAY
jgi:hypothetical protein